MFRSDYRVLLRQFEFERLLVPPVPDEVDFGGRYSDRLLEEFFATDARKLHRTIGRLNETQRTLYAVNALCGQISNGGISQFFFNSQPLLREEVATALERIGAFEFLRDYKELLGRAQADEKLRSIRAAAGEWSDFRDYKAVLEGDRTDQATFDDRYFDGQQATLDRLMRAFISSREEDLVRFCDGSARLEAQWISKLLGRLVDVFDDYQSAYKDGRAFDFFDLLFTPDCREQFGASREVRQENARVVATQLIPEIRKASRKPRLASFEMLPSPRIVVARRTKSDRGGRITISFYENECDLLWLISAWE